MKPSEQSWIQKIRQLLGGRGGASHSMIRLTRGGWIPVQQTKLAPDGLEFSEDVSHGRWIEESVSGWGKVRSLMPDGLSDYARVFHPAYLGKMGEQPVRWSTVASWTGRIVHPQMQFPSIADLGGDPKDMYKDPPWGCLPQEGSIPEKECRTLVNILSQYTSTPDRCFFCLWEGYGGIDSRLYKSSSRVRIPGRDFLLFRGPLNAVMSFLNIEEGFWEDSPSIWWPEDHAWCVATDIDLYDTYVGGSKKCIEAVLSNSELEALRTTPDARVDFLGDTINITDELIGCR